MVSEAERRKRRNFYKRKLHAFRKRTGRKRPSKSTIDRWVKEANKKF